jgi:site-specific DNA-adenine methylase
VALFLYLKRHGYNGLCRYNAADVFHVPLGRYRQPYFPATEMHAFWRKATQAQFVVADFRQVLTQAKIDRQAVTEVLAVFPTPQFAELPCAWAFF